MSAWIKEWDGDLQCLAECQDRNRGEMRVPDSALRSVVYIGNGGATKPFHAIGTGFIVHVKREDGLTANYLVTADHVREGLNNDRQFSIQLNDSAGKQQVMESPPYPQWWKHPTDETVDAAIHGDYENSPLRRFLSKGFSLKRILKSKRLSEWALSVQVTKLSWWDCSLDGLERIELAQLFAMATSP